MSLNNINKAAIVMIGTKQALNQLQELYYGLQSSWSEHLAELIQKLLEEKQAAYALNPSNFKVDWSKESKSSLTELYKKLQKVTNLGRYQDMSREEVDLMMDEYGLREVQSDLEGEEYNMNFVLENGVLPRIVDYKIATERVRSALFKSAVKIGVGPDARKVADSCLSFLSILDPSLVFTSEHAIPNMGFSVDRAWGNSIKIQQDLKGDIGDIFKIVVVKEVVRILVKVPYAWSDDVFKCVFTNVSTVFCIKTSEDMEVMIEGARAQLFLISNRAVIESGELRMEHLVVQFSGLREGQKEQPNPGQSESAKLRFYRLREVYLRTQVLVKDMQTGQQMLQNNTHFSESITDGKIPFVSEGAEAYKEWIESRENEAVSSVLEALAA